MATHTQKSTLIRNTVESMAEVSARIKMRYVANCRRTDLEYGDRSASALGLGTTVR
ncbi:catalase-related domain-containing protein [Rhizobium sp. Root483D2]|uniref:catalase-related domain-containing protein n=1 Tax=Rhizobium sp. Root483D2 TaxID=1736545 RepID=UPI00244ED1D1|nr:catalase-related domain-containing protein [Rhizobium sp. Root483D2]